jgi:hypothetical protein
MAPRTPRRPSNINVSDLHRQWLELVDTDGPFLAIAPLKRVWSQGMPNLAADRKEALLYARKDFEVAWEALDRSAEDGAALDAYRIARDKWVETVLRNVAGWAESLAWGPVPGVQAQSPNRAVTVTAQAALIAPDGHIGALVYVVDSVDSLRKTPHDLWAATPIDRMEALLRSNGVPIGIVTDGRWWGLVCARENAMAASGVVDSLTWVEEPRTRDAFLAVISRQHIIGGDPNERLPVLFHESVAAAEEITEALGAQVRSAVELLIQSFSESAADAQRRGEPDPLPPDTHETYEAAVTVMMRIVFLLFAEERGLLPSGELFEQGYGISRELDHLQSREAEESEEALDATSLTWHRLLATSHALYSGASFENMRVPAYGGSLFDPTRFPFLTHVTASGTLAVTVSDRVMLHALRSVQQAVLKGGEARRISFRDIDVEQIGYIYEGLLGYTAVAVEEIHVGLRGTAGEEPEIPLSVLEQLSNDTADAKKLAEAIRGWVENDQPSAAAQSGAAIAKGVGADTEPSVVSALAQAVGDDPALRERVLPWLGVMRQDLRGRPFVVLADGLMVKETPSRKNAGAHYTPKSLAKEVVLHALEPLCYSPGPYQTSDTTRWKLKSSDDLLSLKIADIACGSGAFLVAAAGYLADRVVEAWTAEDAANIQRRDLYLRAVREVVANCLYGADINDMAVEMCKLSLWLVSLDRDLPFSFVDDKVFLGNSLLGLTRLDQLRKLHIDPSRVPTTAMIDFYDIDIDAIIRKAVELRHKLATEVDENDPVRNSSAKRRQLVELHHITADLRGIADGVVAAGLALGGKPGRALDDAYENLRIAVKAAYPDSGSPDTLHLESIIDTGLTPTVATDYEQWKPLHWVIEAPDVIVQHGGFDAIVGNPAFLHSKKITIAYGKNYREYLQSALAHGAKGDADLAAYFLLRQSELVQSDGAIGIVVTKSINQSHTKRVGLDQIQSLGNVRSSISPPFDWGPAGAAVTVLKLWLYFSSSPAAVSEIASDPVAPRSGLPVASFVGTYPNGDGFRVPADIAQRWIKENPELSTWLHPYVRAADLASGSPSLTSEYLIDINDLSQSDAEKVPILWDYLLEHQKPWRDKPDMPIKLRDRWWDFERSARAMYTELGILNRAIAIPRTSNLLMPRWISTSGRIDMGVVVFASESWSIYSQVASSLHYHWVLSFAATTRHDPSYAPKRVSNTFPWLIKQDAALPRSRDFESALEIQCAEVGGLRSVMNRFNDAANVDSPIVDLRELFRSLDREVLETFGWDDLDPSYGFAERNNLTRYTMDVESQAEVHRRLMAENIRRAEPKGDDASPRRASRRSKSVSEVEGTLFS